MASKKRKKYYRLRQPGARQQVDEEVQEVEEAEPDSTPEFKINISEPLRFALMVTGGFFLIALIGIFTHEMWRDEHQAWLVARDANSLAGLLDNMNYEGNPALWHFFLFLITRVTHDPLFMQVFHLLIATSFIFVFNRYAPLSNLHKILFSFGYFPLYEYAVISRSYALGILLVFGVCALYKNRTTKYILIGVLLALLANVTIYAIILAGGIAGILVMDYFIHQQKSTKITLHLSVGIIIFILGTAFSLYQIWPEKDNTFPAPYATSAFEFARWWQVSSKLFTTYAYIPRIEENFWNTSILSKDPGVIVAGSFSGWLEQNPSFLFSWVLMPIALFASGVIIFLRKPLILLLYTGTTLGLFSIYYYTALLHSRYCGYLLIALVVCYWLAEYYPEKKFRSGTKSYFATLGKRISKPFLTGVLGISVIGTVIAYSMDIQYKFSPSKQVADYIKQNKIDSLPIVGMTDFVVSPLSSYLDKKIYYLQMADTGSFTIWSKKRKNDMEFKEMVATVGDYIDKGHPRVLWIKNSAPQITASDGRTSEDMTKAVVRGDLQVDLINKFAPGIVGDEQYYIYLVQKVDPARVDYTKYIKID
ncbi:MAG TPA: hypothetical protein VFP97_14040 [Chitinophagaceae bacterium]|nr:hypothetical protein [Chitinophagaceae bacterium]